MKQLLLLQEQEGLAILLAVLFLGRTVGTSTRIFGPTRSLYCIVGPSTRILALLGHYCNEVALKEMKGKLAISWDNTYRC